MNVFRVAVNYINRLEILEYIIGILNRDRLNIVRRLQYIGIFPPVCNFAITIRCVSSAKANDQLASKKTSCVEDSAVGYKR